MSISALQTWANEHAAWRLKMALERKACLARESVNVGYFSTKTQALDARQRFLKGLKQKI